jgi:hypothetical protein
VTRPVRPRLPPLSRGSDIVDDGQAADKQPPSPRGRSRSEPVGEDATGPANPQPLVPGQVYRFAVEIWPTAYVFPAGHRIRVALSGSDSLGTAPNPIAAQVTVYQDAAHPSHVEIPIIGAAAWHAFLGKGGGAKKPKE